YGHGTFVSGLISLTAPGCKILPLRAFDTLGLGTTFGITRAIYAAIDEGAEVINMSFSMYSASTALRTAVKDARHAGIVMIASAGNDHTNDSTYPAAFPEVIAVSSIDESEQAAWFSNYGEYVDLCAPGVNLYSALAGDYEWGTWSGTSFSAALVSGACALELGYRTSLTPQQAGEDLIRSARTELAWGIVTPSDAIYYGSGCLDVYEALLGLACGDIDNSGWVDMSDLVGLAEYILDGGPPPVVSLRVADLNCDGVVNAVDLEVMKGLIARGKGLPKPCYLR
ncbi:MAG TPA: S8 family serine peptidase, partial [candidate division Zixibacteria bacterium]|nr:S8 family serine peptidase [candidate division Zixibacteria bacterium]